MGLQISTLFQEEVVGKALLPTVIANWGKLNEGGKCNDQGNLQETQKRVSPNGMSDFSPFS